jgi:hypothetical protein
MKGLHVWNVASDMEGEYLARAGFQYLVAAKPAIEHEAALRRPISLTDHVAIGAHLPDSDGKIENRRLFLIGERGDAFELAQQRG